MTVTVLAFTTVNPDNPAALSAYLASTGPLLEEAGAEIIARSVVNDAVVGTAPGRMMTLLRYPDRAAVDQVFENTEYKLLREIREQAFLDYTICVLEDGADLAALAGSLGTAPDVDPGTRISE